MRIHSYPHISELLFFFRSDTLNRVFCFLQRNPTVSDTDAPQDTWMFIVQADLLPSYIPIRVASKILFVGESVLMFETNQQNAKQESGTSDGVLIHGLNCWTNLYFQLTKGINCTWLGQGCISAGWVSGPVCCWQTKGINCTWLGQRCSSAGWALSLVYCWQTKGINCTWLGQRCSSAG